MKPSAILTADIHLRDDTPLCRTDDYFKAQESKIKFIRGLQDKHGIPVLDAGDLFNKNNSSNYLNQWAILNLPDMITIEGNHDQSYHNRGLYEKTGLAVLEAAGVVKVPTEVLVLENSRTEIHVFPWGAELYSVKPAHDYRKVALVHAMTYTGRKPYPGCEDPGASAVLKKLSGFDLVVTGHNHKSFTSEDDGRILVNPGSLMRGNADQWDYRPRVWLWFAEDNHVEPVPVPLTEGVVSRDHIEKVENREERMDAFVNKLNNGIEVGLSFHVNLERWLATNRVRQRTKEILAEATQ